MSRLTILLDILKLALVLWCAAASGSDLTSDDFTHEASVTVSGVGMSSQAIAYCQERDTFLTVAADGQNPYALKEFRVIEGAATTTLVRSWGNLNADGRLNVTGALVGMRGLHYDDALGGCWLGFGSWYANGANNPCIAFVKLDATTGAMELRGPWKVGATVHSDTVKGKLFEDGLTNLLAFGERGSTAQLQSWGPGLVSIRKPLIDLAPQSEMMATRIVHWPMRQITLSGSSYGYSDFPRLSGKSAVLITGPAATPLFTTFSTYFQPDAINTVSLVDQTFVWTGVEARGYCWYGSPTLYDSLQLDSLVYPGQKMKSANSAQGTHAEQFFPQIHFMRQDDVLRAYDQGGNKQVGFYESADMQSLGGGIVMQQARMTGSFWNPRLRKFYLLNPGLNNQSPKIIKFGVAI